MLGGGRQAAQRQIFRSIIVKRRSRSMKGFMDDSKEDKDYLLEESNSDWTSDFLDSIDPVNPITTVTSKD